MHRHFKTIAAAGLLACACVCVVKQPYFIQQIEQQCLKVEAVFAWEAVPTSSEVVWSQVSLMRNTAQHGACRANASQQPQYAYLPNTHTSLPLSSWCHTVHYPPHDVTHLVGFPVVRFLGT